MQNDFQITPLVRENIRNLVPYSSARDEYSGSAELFLDANENPFNSPLNRYPDPRQSVLKQKIASLKGQEPHTLFVGNGSDEGIDLLFRVLCEPGRDHVIIVEPTYGMYRVCAAINNVACKSVSLREDFSLDAASVLDAVDERSRMIFLCSPNNPTSNSYGREALMEIIENAPCMVVVDEAYIDFSRGKGVLPMVPSSKNLVVLQTLSKAWGVAGIRVGMVFAHPELIGYLSAVKYPYNVNSLSLRSALDALEKGEERRSWVDRILSERERVTVMLGSLRFVERVYPSDANFLLVKMEDPMKVFHYLRKKGIIVRDRSSVPLCEGCLRITVGTEQENTLLLETLEDFERTSENR